MQRFHMGGSGGVGCGRQRVEHSEKCTFIQGYGLQGLAGL